MSIVVTASKQKALLEDYPGTIHMAQFDAADGLRFGGGGSGILLRELPNLTSTDLGEGRNKIFIRGVADSSFNGQTQATISQYFGESRLNYSGPDPDLMLYDVERFEVLEGPQGTLYGAGSLGGVIRIAPRSPQPGETSLAGVAAGTLTQDEPGAELALVGNLPVGSTGAARLVAYRAYRPGYIDDPERGLADINSTDIVGLRASLSLEPHDTLDLEFGALMQDLSSEDGQYTDSGTDALTRHSAIGQPFDSNYFLVWATARAQFDFAELVSTTSAAQQAIDTVFDATPASSAEPLAYVEDRNVALFAHETRLAGSFGPVSSWVAGIALAGNYDRAARAFGAAADPSDISIVRSITVDTALFGEATIGPWHNFSLTAGGRFSWVRSSYEVEFVPDEQEIESRRSQSRFLPTAALSWTPLSGLIVYARYREGYRPGSVRVSGAGEDAAGTLFDADEMFTSEAGLRVGAREESRVWGGLQYSYSRWNEVQADLVTPEGFPYVANLGSGFVRYSSIDLGWRPFDPLVLEASAFLTTSQLDRPSTAFAGLNEEDLPNIADEGWRFSARFDQRLGDAQLTVSGSVGYIGPSFLAIGEPFELPQGRYHDTALGARLDLGDWGISLDIDNVLDERSNRFSFGNPFFVAEGMQRTPLRPRTIRLGVDAQF
ncbi:TonB-dependent receptor [Alteraurantiacibacter aquimixticola]|uniref:TonB-dependent receptor n=1 Tax=Alteraurantiacibacter aquimixticola TaxID=2489173 RepID=A0A4T3F469_9SPHN|nr:TonB-dependent receptor [Alteraurantiacibacter aquimixticola]